MGQVALLWVRRIIETAHSVTVTVAAALADETSLEVVSLISNISAAEHLMGYVPALPEIQIQVRIGPDQSMVALLFSEGAAGFNGSP